MKHSYPSARNPAEIQGFYYNEHLVSTGHPSIRVLQNLVEIVQASLVKFPWYVYRTSVNVQKTFRDLYKLVQAYLALHAACAKVANVSGAGRYIKRTFRELDDMKVLASNGSSVEALSFALGKSCVAVG